MNRRRFLVAAAVAAVVAVAGLISLARTLRQPGAIAQQREAVQELRAAVDSCHISLADQQEDLLAYNAYLDSVRGRVRGMEGLHPRGVPADSYQVYMQEFRRYNDSAAVWDARVEELKAERAACAATTAAHNMALDSLRQLLMQQRRR
jgi:enamine deaminase RidA (YjgF/YER057c/UK114 family)